MSEGERHIGLRGLVFVAYFWVIGGMYGTEPLLSYGPPAYVFLCSFLCPLIFSLPSALICADLGVAYPLDGGMVSWIDLAFGPIVGGHNMYWTWVNYILDAAVYPVLASGYIAQATSLSDSWKAVIPEAFVVFIVLVRLCNFDFLVKFSTALTLASLVPAVLYVGYAFPQVDPSLWLGTSGKQNCTAPYEHCQDVPIVWGELLPFLMWQWSGFFALGTLAGEVKNPGRNIPLATLILIPSVFFNVLLPLALSLPVDQDQSDYSSGQFATWAQQLAGPWLKILITLAALTSLIGECNAGTIVADEALQSFCLRHRPEFFAQQARSSSRWRSWLFDTENRVCAFIALGNGVILAACVWLPFGFLISSSLVIANISMMLVFASYVQFKRRDKSAAWLYSQRWGYALLLTVPPAAFTLAMSGFALFDYPTTLGIEYINVWSTAAVIFLGVAVHVAARGVNWYLSRQAMHPSLATETSPLIN